MSVVLKACRVPWAISPTMSGLTLRYTEPKSDADCHVVFGAGRLGSDGLTDSRRVELCFLGVDHVRASTKRYGDDITALGFEIVGGYAGDLNAYFDWRELVWREHGTCPDSGFYVATKSDRLMGEDARHFVLEGRQCYVEVIAKRYTWREWIWSSGERDHFSDDSTVFATGNGVD
jgi:hypothetical protein